MSKTDGGIEGERIQRAALALRERIGEIPPLLMVLGSGLKGYADSLADAVRVPFDAVPGWPVPQVEGHATELVVGSAGKERVACLAGRVHLYEGWSAAEVVRPMRSLVQGAKESGHGAPTVLLTNAAGGVDDNFRPGDLMVLRDHINLTGTSPLVGAHEEILGPRFPDQTQIYRGDLQELLKELDPTLRSGVYAGLLGPSYETPAEILMLHRMGVSAVGMSTVHEATACHAMGARVAAVSLITNLAAGRSAAPLDHHEVIEVGRAAAERMSRLVSAFATRLAERQGRSGAGAR